jgi:hypothetical protein
LSIRGHVPSDRKQRKRSGILGHFWAVLAFARPSPCSASLLAAVVVLMLSSAGQAASSQCTNTESVLFTCRSGKNVISVCASQLSTDAGLVQYRFGPEGAPDIRLPLAAQDWRTWTRAGMLTYAGGGGAYVAFTNLPLCGVHSHRPGLGREIGGGCRKERQAGQQFSMHARTGFGARPGPVQ